jgi:mannose-6-phosphate isomerase-like protein (cupin superfamily)
MGMEVPWPAVSLGAFVGGACISFSWACAAGAAYGLSAGRTKQRCEQERTRCVRRVVTGNDASGKAVVLADDKEAPNQFEPPMRDGVQVNNIWRVNTAPPVLEVGDGIFALETAPAGEKIPLHPPSEGNVFRVISFSPEANWIDKVQRGGSNWLPLAEGHNGKPAPHPLMHRSETIDYGIILTGEITLVLDDSEVLCRAGDVVVQRGTSHAWSNRSDRPCRVAFVLCDAKFSPALATKFAGTGH